MTRDENPRPALDLGIAALARKAKAKDFITVVGTAEKTQDGKYYIVDVMPCSPGGVIQIPVSEVEINPLKKDKCDATDDEIQLSTIKMKRNAPIITIHGATLTDSLITSLQSKGAVDRPNFEDISAIHTSTPISVLIVNNQAVAVGCYEVNNGLHQRAMVNPHAQMWVSFNVTYIAIAIPGPGAGDGPGWGKMLWQGIAGNGQTITV